MTANRKVNIVPRSAISAITVVRRRMPAAALSADRARRAATGLFGPRRAHPRTVVALPCRPGWYPSPDARPQTAWRLRSGSRQTPPLPAASDGGRARHRRRSSKLNRSARAADPQLRDARPIRTARRQRARGCRRPRHRLPRYDQIAVRNLVPDNSPAARRRQTS